jgi:transposase
MTEATLPTTTYNPAGINVFPAPVVDLFRYENIYKNTNGDFAVEYRKQIIELRNQGHKLHEIAENLNCSISAVKKWLRRNRKGDLISDKSRAPLHREVKNTQYNQYLVGEILNEFPFYGCRRIAHEIEKQYGEMISYRTIIKIMKDIAPKKEVVIPERIEIDEIDAILAHGYDADEDCQGTEAVYLRYHRCLLSPGYGRQELRPRDRQLSG